ncbi:MAG: Hsp33 family molecular chaperone HslO [Ruminococcus sp.]
MDKITRCITHDGAVMAAAIDSTETVFTAQKIHNTTPVATAALGRLLSATSIMGAMLKNPKATINLQVAGDGELGIVTAVANSKGHVKGYVGNPNCTTEYYENGHLNVGKAVGNGILNVMRDEGSGEPYIGKVPLVSGEIAEDIASYYATSEQIPTVCALGVLLDKSGMVLASGGVLLQMLPGAFESDIDRIEENLKTVPSVTRMLADGLTPVEMAEKFLKGYEVDVLDEFDVGYYCTCSKEKIENIIAGMPESEILSLPDENGVVKAGCQFCNKEYTFTEDDLKKLIDKKKI